MIFRRLYITNISIVLLFAVGFFTQCAQPAAPTGGPNDTIPPVLLNVTPANYSLNFDSREIVFTYNEYLQIKDVQKEVLFSPPLSSRPIISVKGKSIVVKFPPELELDSNTTYKIDFGNAILDNNEGNIARRIQYVFSTGDVIDSLHMSGKLVNALTGEDIINGFVFFYEDKIVSSDIEKGDSTIFKGKKLYLARTDSTGNFLATNLKAMPYRIFAIQDENGNLEYDMGTDLVGLSNSRFNPVEMEEFHAWVDPIKNLVMVSPQTKLLLFKEYRKLKQDLKEVKRTQELLIELEFASDSVVIRDVFIDSVENKNILIENVTYNDSIKVWVRKGENNVPDTLKGYIAYEGTDSIGRIIVDTTKFNLSFTSKQDEQTGADKIAEKFGNVANNLFTKFRAWIKRVFMGKKRKIELSMIAEKRFIADSIAKIKTDSIAFKVRQDSIITADSLASLGELNIKRDSAKIFTPRLSVSGETSPYNEIYLLSDYPLDLIDTAKINVLRLSYKEKNEDSFDMDEVELKEKKPTIKEVQKYAITRSKDDFTNYLFEMKLQPNSEYQITIDKDALLDMSGATNDSLTFTVKTYNPEKFARVILDIKLIDSLAKNSYIINILDSASNVVGTKFSKGEGQVIFDYLPEQKYKLMFIEDVNSNNIQDIGVVMNNIEPEKVELYFARPNLNLFPTKENWDSEFEIFPEKIFDKNIEIPKTEMELLMEKIDAKQLVDSIMNMTKDKRVIDSIINIVKKDNKQLVDSILNTTKDKRVIDSVINVVKRDNKQLVDSILNATKDKIVVDSIINIVKKDSKQIIDSILNITKDKKAVDSILEKVKKIDVDSLSDIVDKFNIKL